MAFNALINSIAPLSTPSDWVRPSDWIAITDTPNEVQFLVCDTGTKAFTIQTTFSRTTGNIYIDWGDGVTDTISTTTSTNTSHVYSTGGTPCSRGYNTFKIRIYGDATCKITNARHIPNFATTGGSATYNIGLLEAYFGDGTCDTTALFSNYFYSNNTQTIGGGTFLYLEYVKLPVTVTWNSQMNFMFSGCRNLYVIVMPTSAASLTNVQSTFASCTNLRDIVLPSNSTLISNMNGAFGSCTNLRTITFPTSLNLVTSMSSVFSGCSSLKNLTFPSLNICTDFSSNGNCFALQWVRFTSLPSPAVSNTSINFASAFSNCYHLQNVYFPSSCSSNAMYVCNQTFQNCYSLKNIVFPINFNTSNLSTCFSTCTSLTSVIFQSATPSLTTLSGAFQNCYSLSSITLPSTVGTLISMQNSFLNCFSLTSITIPSGWNISNLSGTFSGCNYLKSIILPNNPQNSCTTMASMCNNCFQLETITMPTSLNGVTLLTTTFGSCYKLSSVTFPASMNAVTAATNCFSSCFALNSVTMPTSMTSCTDFSFIFATCIALETVTLPINVSASTTTFQGAFLSCSNLKTITLPTTQTSLLNSIVNLFTYCASLTTINNSDKLGSLTATPLVSGALSVSTGSFTNQLTSLSFSCPFSQLTLNGNSTTLNFNKLNSLRLLNTSAGQWTGTSPQINVSFCDLSTAALNTLFADIAAQGTVVGKTINITSCTGAAGLTPANRAVLTGIGWTITG